MPYISLTTNVSIEQPQAKQLVRELSALMAKATGKPERYVMADVKESEGLLFAGSDAPAAYLECKSIGLSSAQAKTLSAEISAALNAQLKLAADRIYIEFSDCRPEFWGWNGGTFG